MLVPDGKRGSDFNHRIPRKRDPSLWDGSSTHVRLLRDRSQQIVERFEIPTVVSVKSFVIDATDEVIA